MGILKSRKQNYNEFGKTNSDQSLIDWTGNSKSFCFLLLIEYHQLNPRPTNKQSNKKFKSNVLLQKIGYIGVIRRTFSVKRGSTLWETKMQNYSKIIWKYGRKLRSTPYKEFKILNIGRISCNVFLRLQKTLEIGFDFNMDKIANQESRCRNVYQISPVLGLTGKDRMGFGW